MGSHPMIVDRGMLGDRWSDLGCNFASIMWRVQDFFKLEPLFLKPWALNFLVIQSRRLRSTTCVLLQNCDDETLRWLPPEYSRQRYYLISSPTYFMTWSGKNAIVSANLCVSDIYAQSGETLLSRLHSSGPNFEWIYPKNYTKKPHIQSSSIPPVALTLRKKFRQLSFSSLRGLSSQL